jgi:hypothetical protein
MIPQTIEPSVLRRLCSRQDVDFVRQNLGKRAARRFALRRAWLFHIAMVDTWRQIRRTARMESLNQVATPEQILEGYRSVRRAWLLTYVRGMASMAGWNSGGFRAASTQLFAGIATMRGQAR